MLFGDSISELIEYITKTSEMISLPTFEKNVKGTIGMKITRMALSVCFCLSALCLLLSVGTLVSLRRAVVETDSVRRDAEALIFELNDYKNTLSTSTDTQIKEELSVDAPQVSFCLRAIGDRIGIYADGQLISTLDISISALPTADRVALSQGITADSAEELAAIIQDFS